MKLFIIISLFILAGCSDSTQGVIDTTFQAELEYAGYDPEHKWYYVISSEITTDEMIRVDVRDHYPPTEHIFSAVLDKNHSDLYVMISHF